MEKSRHAVAFDSPGGVFTRNSVNVFLNS